ncbi:MAG: hypothetical protein LBG46_03200 [Elusimicrobiota bacterium]|nr:hypothetical protein [Elusimicrobiota bacterium]
MAAEAIYHFEPRIKTLWDMIEDDGIKSLAAKAALPLQKGENSDIAGQACNNDDMSAAYINDKKNKLRKN